MRACLEKAGYAVKNASDGLTAMHIVRADKPSVVLLDTMSNFSRSRLREYVSSRIRNPAGLMLESPPNHGSGSVHQGKS